MGEPFVTTDVAAPDQALITSPERFRALEHRLLRLLQSPAALAPPELLREVLGLEHARARLTGARLLPQWLALGWIERASHIERLELLLQRPQPISYALQLDVESDFFALVDGANAEELVALAELVHHLPRRSIKQALLTECIEALVRLGRIEEALALEAHVDWLGYVVRAAVALIPHVDAATRAHILDRAWLQVQGCPLEDIYHIEPLLELVVHFQPDHLRDARLRSIEAMIEAFPPEDLQPSPDFKHPLIHLACAHATLGRSEHAIEILHSLPAADFVYGAIALASTFSGEERMELGLTALETALELIGKSFDGFSLPIAKIAALHPVVAQRALEGLEHLPFSNEEYVALGCELATALPEHARGPLFDALLERARALRTSNSHNLEDVWLRLLESLLDLSRTSAPHLLDEDTARWLSSWCIQARSVELIEAFAPLAPTTALEALLDAAWRQHDAETHSVKQMGALRAVLLLSERLPSDAPLRAEQRARALNALERHTVDDAIWSRLHPAECARLVQAHVLAHRRFLDDQRLREHLLSCSRLLPTALRQSFADRVEDSPLLAHERARFARPLRWEPAPPTDPPAGFQISSRVALLAMARGEPQALPWLIAFAWHDAGPSALRDLVERLFEAG